MMAPSSIHDTSLEDFSTSDINRSRSENAGPAENMITGSETNERLYFLPPVADAPVSFNGIFNGSLSPAVRITGEGIDHLFDSEDVKVDYENEHYSINWHTKEFNGVSGTDYRITVLLNPQDPIPLELGYLDITLVESMKNSKKGQSEGLLQVLNGRTLPIKFRIEEGAETTVGPAGGTISVFDGQVTLLFPPGALYGFYNITVTPVPMSAQMLESRGLVDGTVYDFGPDGLEFAEPVELTINIPQTVQNPNSLTLLHNNGIGWIELTSTLNNDNSLTGLISGFSKKAVGSKVTSIVTAPDVLSMQMDSSAATLTANTFTGTGTEIFFRTVSWIQSPPSGVVSLQVPTSEFDNFGRPTVEVTPLSVGNASVTAKIKGVTGTTDVTVKSGIPSGSLFGWGYNGQNQIDVPAGNDYVAVAAGQMHNVALKADGSLVHWGISDYGLSDVPAGNDFVAIAANGNHNIALKADGSLVAWGWNAYNQTDVPAGNDFVAIAAGMMHSLAIKADGSLVAWGSNSYGESDVPAGNDFVAISAGYYYSVAIKADGSLVAWGSSNNTSDVPAGNNFTKVSSFWVHDIALREDGSLAVWGIDMYNQGATVTPEGNDFIAIASGGQHNLTIKSDGSLYAWGRSSEGQTAVPSGNDFIAIAAGSWHSVAIGN